MIFYKKLLSLYMKVKVYINQLLNIIIMFMLFAVSEKTYDITKWNELSAEMFSFYALAFLVFNRIQRYK